MDIFSHSFLGWGQDEAWKKSRNIPACARGAGLKDSDWQVDDCAAETAGFAGIALMDHLAPPMAERQDMYDAMSTAMWLVAQTDHLTISHLVLCDAFRHPAVLARQAVTLDQPRSGNVRTAITNHTPSTASAAEVVRSCHQ